MSNYLTARDIMTHDVITVTPDQNISSAIGVLTTHRISGAPVVDESGALVGILSERDCLSVLSQGSYYRSPEAVVSAYMSPALLTIPPDADIFSIADLFLPFVF